jgi:hypothetical protein
MELSSRQIIALAAPVVISYLTWSTVGGQMTTLRKLTSAASTAPSALRPEIGPLARNPFAPASLKLDPAALLSDGEEAEEPQQLRLDGTAVAGRWRMAIINGQRVFEGQTVGMMRVQSVSTDGVTLLDPGGRTVRLTLDIAPASPASKPGAPAAGSQAGKTPLEAGLDALKSGAGGDVLESLGIPRS